MGNNLAILGTRTLPQLTLPASHDSGMYLSSFPASLARTQSLTIYQQLSAGIRYFDLRPEWSSNQLFIHHGKIAGPALAEILSDIQKFTRESHRELILLKFSHFDTMTSAAYDALVQQIQKSLAPWLYTSLPPAKKLSDIPLSSYLERSTRILVLCDSPFPVNKKVPGIWIYRDWESGYPQQGDLRVYDQYANTMSFESMEADQFGKFENYTGRCRDHSDLPCDLFLLSWTLTPPTGVLALAKRSNAQLATALQNVKLLNASGCRINLLYADDVDTFLTEAAISLNARQPN